MREGRGGAQPSGMRRSGAWAALFGVWVALVGCGEEATEPPAPAPSRAVTAPTFADVATPPLLERAGESLLALPMASVEAGALYIVELEVTPQLQVSLTQARLTASPGEARRAALGAVKAELLGRIGIVSSDALAKGRKYAIVGILCFAAFFTPPDVISQILLTVPVLMLYEISIWCVKLIEKKQAEEDAARE